MATILLSEVSTFERRIAVRRGQLLELELVHPGTNEREDEECEGIPTPPFQEGLRLPGKTRYTAGNPTLVLREIGEEYRQTYTAGNPTRTRVEGALSGIAEVVYRYGKCRKAESRELG